MTSKYYDDLSPYYKLIYQDWNASVRKQALLINEVIKSRFGKGGKEILDAACGIGTQSIGLAEIGHRITACDISLQEIEIAKLEAINRGLDISFLAIDMREVYTKLGKEFDLVIALDNALPHLSDPDQILQAFQQFNSCTKIGGGCLISVRNYEEMNLQKSGSKMYPRTIHDLDKGRTVLFDIWDFCGEKYEITTYIIEENQNSVTVNIIKGGKYFCVRIPELEKLLLQAGFKQVEVLSNYYFQPLIIASKHS